MEYEALRSDLELDEELVFGASRIVERWAGEQGEHAERVLNDEYAIVRAASLFVRAGTLWLLRDVDHAMPLFARASQLYLRVRRPSALLAAACGGEWHQMRGMTLEVEADRDSEGTASELDVQRYAGLVLADVLGREEPDLGRLHAARARVASYARPTGRLELPVASQLAVLRRLEAFAVIRTLEGYGGEVGSTLSELELPTDAETELAVGTQLVAPFVAFLIEVDERVEHAMRDRHHWRLIQSRQLPIEPEVLALALGVLVASSQAGTEAELATTVQEEVSARAAIPVRLAEAVHMTMRVGA